MNGPCRIFFVTALALLAPLDFHAGVKPRANAAKTYRVYVGTYTTKTTSKGIYQFRYDPATGKLSRPELAAETADPSWVIVHPNGRYLYAANEAGKASTISAFAIDAKSGKLTLLNQLPALGEDPCYLSFDKTGKYLFAANYTSGNVVVFPIGSDGKLGEHTALIQNKGTLGPNKERQEAPHAHWVEPDTSNRRVYVADLGLDRILIYVFDPKSGKLTEPPLPADMGPRVALAQGTGPRHAAFSAQGDFLYVLGEMGSAVTFCLPEAQHGFAPVSTISTLPPDYQGRKEAAEIQIHPSGKFLYASNRGHDSIAIFALETDGTLRKVDIVPTEGKEPRHFAIGPGGQFLLAENQFSDAIVEFRIDPSTGRLTATGETLSVPSPVCIALLPID